MTWLIRLRWWMLGAAFLCALTWAGTYVLPYGVKQALPLGAALYGAGPLQALGVFAMSRHLGVRGGLAIGLGYAAALLWVAALFASEYGASEGVGGLEFVTFIVPPAIALAGILQFVALVLFALRERSPR